MHYDIPCHIHKQTNNKTEADDEMTTSDSGLICSDDECNQGISIKLMAEHRATNLR